MSLKIKDFSLDSRYYGNTAATMATADLEGWRSWTQFLQCNFFMFSRGQWCSVLTLMWKSLLWLVLCNPPKKRVIKGKTKGRHTLCAFLVVGGSCFASSDCDSQSDDCGLYGLPTRSEKHHTLNLLISQWESKHRIRLHDRSHARQIQANSGQYYCNIIDNMSKDNWEPVGLVWYSI